MVKPKLKNDSNDNVQEAKIVSNEIEPFAIMERADEEQILAELMGNFLDEFVYEFEQQGHKVTGLSLAGVRETVRYMNKNGMARISISDREPKVREEDDWIEVWVYAKDELNGSGAWGIKRQVKKYVSGRINEFAMEQALSKAQRNAQRALIPENYVKEMITKFKGQGKSKDLTGKDKSQKLVTDKQIKRLYAMEREAGLDPQKTDDYIKQKYQVDSKKELTMVQIDEIFKGLDKKIEAKKIADEFEESEQGKLKV